MSIQESCEEAQQRLNPLGDLHDLAVFLNTEEDLESRLDELARLAARATSAASCSIMLLVDDDENETATLKLWACTEKLPADAWSNNPDNNMESIAGRVLERGEPILIADIESSEFASLSRRRADIGFSFISAPIRTGQRTIGVMNLSGRPEAASFGEADLTLASIVGALIGRSVQVEWLRKLARSRIAQATLARESQEVAIRLTDGSLPPSRLAKILAKSFYKDLAAAGFNSGQIVEAASEIIGQISGDLSRHKKRMERETGES